MSTRGDAYRQAFTEEAAARDRIAELEAALKPFADFMDAFDRQPINGLDRDEVYGIHGGYAVEGGTSIRWKDLRTARAVLKGEK